MSMQRGGPYQSLDPHFRGADPRGPFHLDVDFCDLNPRDPNYRAVGHNPNYGQMRHCDSNFESVSPWNPNFTPVGLRDLNIGSVGPRDPNFRPTGPWDTNFRPTGPWDTNFGPAGPWDTNFGSAGPWDTNLGHADPWDPNFRPVHPRGPYDKPMDPCGSLEDRCKPVSAMKVIDGVQGDVKDKVQKKVVFEDQVQKKVVFEDQVQKKVVEEDKVQKKVEDKLQKNVIDKVQKKVVKDQVQKKVAEEDEVPIPEELLNMFQKRKCELCMCVLPNSNQADVHYIGTMHFRRMKRYLKLWSEREKKEVHPSCWTLVRTHKNANNTQLPRDGSAEMCKVCNKYFQSAFHARLHYKGKQHEKAIVKYIEKHPNAKVITGISLRKLVCDICNLSVFNEASFKGHLQGKKHKKNVERFERAKAEEKEMQVEFIDLEKEEGNEIGNVRKPVQDNHVASSTDSTAKAQKVDIDVADSHIKDLFCKLCNVKIASEEEIGPHVSSQNHRNEVKWHKKHGMSTVGDLVGENIECEICKIKFRSKSDYDSHLRWNSHVNKKTMLEKQYTRKHQTCELCRMDFFSEQSYEAHFSTPLHIGNKQWAKEWKAKQDKSVLPVEEKPTPHSGNAKNIELVDLSECKEAKDNSKLNVDTCLESNDKGIGMKSKDSSEHSKYEFSQLENETGEASEDKTSENEASEDKTSENDASEDKTTVFECKLCSVSVVGIMAYEHHIGSTKHILRLSLQIPGNTTDNALESTSNEQKPTLTAAKNIETSKTFCCELCGTHSNTFNQYKSHLESVKHKKNVATGVANKLLTQRNTYDSKLSKNMRKGILKSSAELSDKLENIDNAAVNVSIKKLDNKTPEKFVKAVDVDVQSEFKPIEPSPSNLTSRIPDEAEDSNIFECKHCGISVVGSVSYEFHVGSMQHILKLAHTSSKEVDEPSKEHHSSLVESNTKAQETYHCEMCNYSSISSNQHESHLKSNKHKSAIAALEIARAKSKQKPTHQATSEKVIEVTSHVEKNIHQILQDTEILHTNGKTCTETPRNTEISGRTGRTLAEISRSLREKKNNDVCLEKTTVSSKPSLSTEIVSCEKNLVETTQSVEVTCNRKLHLPTTYATEMSTKKNTYPERLPKIEISHVIGRNVPENILNAPKNIKNSELSDAMKRALQRFQTPKAITAVHQDTAVSDAIRKALQRIQTAEIPRPKEKSVPERLLSVQECCVTDGSILEKHWSPKMSHGLEGTPAEGLKSIETTLTSKTIHDKYKNTEILQAVEKKVPQRFQNNEISNILENILSRRHENTEIFHADKAALTERHKNTEFWHAFENTFPEQGQNSESMYDAEKEQHKKYKYTKFLHAVEKDHERCRESEILHAEEMNCGRHKDTEFLSAVEKKLREKLRDINTTVLHTVEMEHHERQQGFEALQFVKRDYSASNRDIAVLHAVKKEHQERHQDFGAVEKKHPERCRETEILHHAEKEYRRKNRDLAVLHAMELEHRERHRGSVTSRYVEKERRERCQGTEIEHSVAREHRERNSEILHAVKKKHLEADISESSEVSQISNDPLKMNILNTLLRTSMSDRMRQALIDKLKTTEISQLMDGILPDRSQNTEMSSDKDRIPPEKPQNTVVTQSVKNRHCESPEDDKSSPRSRLSIQGREKSYNLKSMTVERPCPEKTDCKEECSLHPDDSSGKKFACKVCQVNYFSSSEFIEHTESQEHAANVDLLRRFIARFRRLANSEYEENNVTEDSSYKCFKCGFSCSLVRDFNRHILETHWLSVLAVRKRKHQESLLETNSNKPSTSYSLSQDEEMQQTSLIPMKHARKPYNCTSCRKSYAYEEDYKIHLKSDLHKNGMDLCENRSNSRVFRSDHSLLDQKYSLQESAAACEVTPSSENQKRRGAGVLPPSENQKGRGAGVLPPSENQKGRGTNRKCGQVVQSWSRQAQAVPIPSTVQISQMNPPVQKFTSENIEVTIISANMFNNQS